MVFNRNLLLKTEKQPRESKQHLLNGKKQELKNHFARRSQ